MIEFKSTGVPLDLWEKTLYPEPTNPNHQSAIIWQKDIGPGKKYHWEDEATMGHLIKTDPAPDQ